MTITSITVSDYGSLQAGNPYTYRACALNEEFTSFTPRTGGPSYQGLMSGTGLWATPRWWSPADVTDGYGFDKFLTPSHALGAGLYARKADGLHLMSRPMTDAEWASLGKPMASKAGTSQRPLISANLSTFYALRVKPPFVVEFEATLPPQTLGRIPFSALWLYTCGRSPTVPDAREAEVDIELFGNRMGLTVHDWPYQAEHKQYDHPFAGFDQTKRHRYTIEMRAWGIRFSIDGKAVDGFPWPAGVNWNQHWQVILNNSSGIPWAEQKQPYLYPAPDAAVSDMIVHSVRWYAENEAQIWRN